MTMNTGSHHAPPVGDVRVPPCDDTAERAVLGAILMDNNVLKMDLAGLEPGQFYREHHRNIFAAILRMAERGAMIDVITLSTELQDSGHLKAAGGANYIAGMASDTSSTVNAPSYARIVAQKSQMRALIARLRQAEDELYGSTEDHAERMDSIQRDILALTSSTSSADAMVPILAHVKAHLGDLERKTEGTDDVIMTGLRDLDEYLHGYTPGDLVVIGARPSVGKTVLGLELIRLAAERGVPCAVFSLEMTGQSLAKRLICRTARVDNERVNARTMTGADWARYIPACASVGQLPIDVDDTAGVQLHDLAARLRMVVGEHGVRLVLVDYLQLVRVRSAKSRVAEVEEVSRTLKELAKEMQVTIIALAQLNRGVTKREGARPTSSDLKGSGEIEQSADVIMLLDREEMRDPETPRAGVMDVIISKARDGACGTVELRFIGHHYGVCTIDEEDTPTHLQVATDAEG